MTFIKRFPIWLAGADYDLLQKCDDKAEMVKYGAFGASVLVPVLFGMIGSSYAISTLTPNPYIIGGFALIWGFIIMTIDRVLLATYRAYTSFSKKVVQFVLRIMVAVLMGLTVSHPLTLLLFKDTIASEIEKQRDGELSAMREKSAAEKKVLEARMQEASATLSAQQQKYQDTLAGDFLQAAATPAPVAPVAMGTDPAFADIDAQIREYKSERDLVRSDLEQWQNTYDEEIKGVRSGKSGVGPNARAIEKDHLVWRREEVKRINNVISQLTANRTRMSSTILERNTASNARIEESRKNLEKQKLDMFASQQGQLLEVIKTQIDAASSELARLEGDAKQLSEDATERLGSVKVEKRADLMTQTTTLHHLFKNPEAGGLFALVVYIVITGLFTLIDTIPLVVKFLSVPGKYDGLLAVAERDYAMENKLPAEKINEKYKDKLNGQADIISDMDSHRRQLRQKEVKEVKEVEDVERLLKQRPPPESGAEQPKSQGARQKNGNGNGNHSVAANQNGNGYRNNPMGANGYGSFSEQAEENRFELAEEEVAPELFVPSGLINPVSAPPPAPNGNHQDPELPKKKVNGNSGAGEQQDAVPQKEIPRSAPSKVDPPQGSVIGDGAARDHTIRGVWQPKTEKAQPGKSVQEQSGPPSSAPVKVSVKEIAKEAMKSSTFLDAAPEPALHSPQSPPPPPKGDAPFPVAIPKEETAAQAPQAKRAPQVPIDLGHFNTRGEKPEVPNDTPAKLQVASAKVGPGEVVNPIAAATNQEEQPELNELVNPIFQNMKGSGYDVHPEDAKPVDLTKKKKLSPLKIRPLNPQDTKE